MARNDPARRDLQRFPLGYSESKRAVTRLKEFRDLVIHHRHFGPYIESARPIAELLPPGTPENRQHTVLEELINKRIPYVSFVLRRAGAPTVVTWVDNTTEWNHEANAMRPRNKEYTSDLVTDYFQLRRHDEHAEMFEMLVGTLDQGIGFYEDHQETARRRRYNALDWIAYVLSLPMRILDTAGLLDTSSTSLGMTIFGWILKAIVVALLFLAATYFGFKIPWDTLLKLIK